MNKLLKNLTFSTLLMSVSVTALAATDTPSNDGYFVEESPVRVISRSVTPYVEEESTVVQFTSDSSAQAEDPNLEPMKLYVKKMKSFCNNP